MAEKPSVEVFPLIDLDPENSHFSFLFYGMYYGQTGRNKMAKKVRKKASSNDESPKVKQ